MSVPFSLGLSTTYVDRAFSKVESELARMNQRADQSLSVANQIIGQLQSTEVQSNSIPPPRPPDIRADDYAVDLPDFEEPDASGVTPDIGELGNVPFIVPSVNAVVSDILDGIAAFEPSAVTITVPEPPSPIDISGAPTSPDLPEVELPDAPAFELPALDAMVPIDIPAFDFPDLPTFDAEPPEFDAERPTVSELAQFNETPYQVEVMPDVVAKIRDMLAGRTGLPEPIERALYERAVDRENMTAQQNIQQAFDAWAGRGFEMPPGMLVEQVNAAREQAALRTNTVNREIAVEVARIAIENVRIAVAQGIAAEQAMFEFWNATVQRAFDMARLRVESEMRMFDAEVALYNAEQSAYRVAAEVYRARIEGALAEVQVYRARIDGELAKGQLNESIVRAYAAKIDGVRAAVEIYRTSMQGAEIRSSVNRNRIDQYRAEVEAYRQQIEARKVEFDAYESQGRGEVAKANIVQAQADAFASTIRGAEAKGNLAIQNARLKLEAINSATQRFTATVGYEREAVSAKAQIASARLAAFDGRLRLETAKVQATQQNSEARVRALDSLTRTKLSEYEIAVRQYDTTIQQLIQKGQIVIQAITSAGQMASQLAAGAMSAINVSAAMRGGSDANIGNNASHTANWTSEF